MSSSRFVYRLQQGCIISQINNYQESILEYFEDYGYEPPRKEVLEMGELKEALPVEEPEQVYEEPTRVEPKIMSNTPLKHLSEMQNLESPTLESLGLSSYTWNLIDENGQRRQKTPLKRSLFSFLCT